MDPGRQIYLSNNKKNFGQKWFLNDKIKNIFQKKRFSDKIWEKQNLGKKKFWKKKFFF